MSLVDPKQLTLDPFGPGSVSDTLGRKQKMRVVGLLQADRLNRMQIKYIGLYCYSIGALKAQLGDVITNRADWRMRGDVAVTASKL